MIIGKDDRLFYFGDYECLINPGFLRQEVLLRRKLNGVQPDPRKAIRDFYRQLRVCGIKLIIVPVPSKPMICPEALGGKVAPLQNPSFAEFKKDMWKPTASPLSTTSDYAEFRSSGVELFLKTDTHWTIEGMKLAARTQTLWLDAARQNGCIKAAFAVLLFD